MERCPGGRSRLTDTAVIEANIAAHRQSCAAEFVVSRGVEVDLYRLAATRVDDQLILRVYCPACGRLIEEHHGVDVDDDTSWHRVGVVGSIRLLADRMPLPI